MKAPGTLSRGELWARCWVCGDSQDLRRAHLSINVSKGLWHCYRCGAGGKLSLEEMLKIGLGDPLSEPPTESDTGFSFVEVSEALQPGAGTDRPSLLKRQHLVMLSDSHTRIIDVFEQRDLPGSIIGYHLRFPQPAKLKGISVGSRAFGFVGKHCLGRTWLRLVEGPYDVVEPEDVATFGFPSESQLKRLVGFPLILCPDGDIWESQAKFMAYFRVFFKFQNLAIISVEKLPAGKDPDEIPTDERESFTWLDLRRLYHGLKKSDRH